MFIFQNRSKIKNMKYIDVSQAAKKWGLSDRRIRYLCNEGRIDGAIKMGWSWTIPEDTPRPRDGRVLRHFKNMDIRPGGVDVDRLLEFQILHPVSSQMKSEGRMNHIILSNLLYLFDKEKIIVEERDVKRILSGKIVPSVSLETHLLIVNFRSVLLSLIDMKEPWTDKDFRLAYSRLMQGIDDVGSMTYRDGYSLREVRGKNKVRVDVQMETLLSQYESWKALNGIVSGVMLYGELERISPFEKYPSFFSYLVLSGELLRNNIYPPLFSLGDKGEFDGAYFIALKRGNYKDFTSFVESRVLRSYKINV